MILIYRVQGQVMRQFQPLLSMATGKTRDAKARLGEPCDPFHKDELQ
jgi:hypothetical protein